MAVPKRTAYWTRPPVAAVAVSVLDAFAPIPWLAVGLVVALDFAIAGIVGPAVGLAVAILAVCLVVVATRWFVIRLFWFVVASGHEVHAYLVLVPGLVRAIDQPVLVVAE